MKFSIQNLLAGALIAVGCSGDNSRATAGGETGAAGRTGRREESSRRARGWYVGVTYSALPQGVTFVSGAGLSSPGDARGAYAFARVATPHGDMIWLDTIATRARTVRGELHLPPLAADERLFISSCDLAGHLNPRVIAIVVNEPNVTRYTRVRQAWLANLQTGRFEIVPVAGVVCDNAESGSA